MKIRDIIREHERRSENAISSILAKKSSVIGNDVTKLYFDYLETEVEIKSNIEINKKLTELKDDD